MFWLIGSLAYAMAGMLGARALAGHLAWRMHRVERAKYGGYRQPEYPTGEQWFGAWMTALCLAVVWPLVVVAIVSPWRMGDERKAELAERERRIREAEKELGIGA